MRDKIRRLKFFPCALYLIKNSRQKPISKANPNKSGETVHRFFGITPDGEIFFVQIKEELRRGQKWLISVFPLN